MCPRLTCLSLALCLVTAIVLPTQSTAAKEIEQSPSQRLIRDVSGGVKTAGDVVLAEAALKLLNRQMKEAIYGFESAFKVYGLVGNRRGQITALSGSGATYALIGDYYKAIEHYQKGLTIAQKINHAQAELTFLRLLGSAYERLQEYAIAVRYYDRALVRLRKPIASRPVPGQERFQQQNLLLLGGAIPELKGYAEAEDYFQHHLKRATQLGDRFEELIALTGLGNHFFGSGDYGKATELYQQGLTLAQAQQLMVSESQLLGYLGDCAIAQQNYAQALEIYQQQWNLAEDVNRQSANPLPTRGNAPDGKLVALSRMSFALLKLGKLAEAERLLMQAIQIGDETIAQSLESKGAADSDRWSQLNIKDKQRRDAYEIQQQNYAIWQQLLIAQNQPEQALEVAERSRARATVELMSQRLYSNNPPSAIVPPTLEQIKKIAWLQNATLVQYAVIDVDRIVGDETLLIWVIDPKGKITSRQVDLKPLQQQQFNLDRVVAASRCFSVVGNCPDLTTIASRSSGSPSGSATNSSAADSPERNFTGLQALHRLLIRPIADLLPTDPQQRVIFIPHGALFLVPFPALLDANNRYLLEQHTISTAPAIQVLEMTWRQRISGRSRTATGQGIPPKFTGTNSFILGNPTMPKVLLQPGKPAEPLAALPGAEAEAKAVAQLLNAPVVLGREATKAIALEQMPTAKLIHLATHGLLDNLRGLGSNLALAPDGDDNGLLTADEILNLKLQADLVVLSACNTGRGKVTGDGVVGMARSLIAAGVPSAIVSLWAVPDAPTASLMTQFYQSLQANPNKAQALRQAMLLTMAKYPNPRDWAAFTLIGEAE
jgi:CHAT domain-containing protein/tetratricopeptide (TPR) repeat protein